ncbi:MAG: TnpV protein [Clostridia bacterium]|nr:TnpV protein [Clostridia bacterium]
MIMEQNTKLEYRKVGDYMIPNLKLPPEESALRLGKWGMLHKNYLEKHNPIIFATLLTQGNLYQHCAEIDTQAQQMFNTLTAQMIKSENITEQLKEQNQLEWVKQMNNIQNRATEIVNEELIYV